jgi:hypothetical protein
MKFGEENKSISVECKVSQSYINSNQINQNNNNNNTIEKLFNFDWVFNDQTTQESFYDIVATPILKSFFQGYNCTIFAYGQTGSG